MSINIPSYINMDLPVKTKQTYIDKFDKSIKLPFAKMMINQMPNLKPVQSDEIKPDDSDFAVSDNVELSSAVTEAAALNNSQ